MLKINKIKNMLLLLVMPMAVLASQKEGEQVEALVSSGDYCEFLKSEGLSKEKKDLIKKYLETKYKAAFDGLRNADYHNVNIIGNCKNIQISPDGKYIICNHVDRREGCPELADNLKTSLKFINVKTGKESVCGEGVHPSSIYNDLMVSPDGKWLIKVSKTLDFKNSPYLRDGYKGDISVNLIVDKSINEPDICNVTTFKVDDFKKAYISPSSNYLITETECIMKFPSIGWQEFPDTLYKSFYLENLNNKKNSKYIQVCSGSEIRYDSDHRVISALTADDKFFIYKFDNKIYIKDLENFDRPAQTIGYEGIVKELKVSSNNLLMVNLWYSNKILIYKLNKLDQDPMVLEADEKGGFADKTEFSPDNKFVIADNLSSIYKFPLNDPKNYKKIDSKQFSHSGYSWRISPCGGYLHVLALGGFVTTIRLEDLSMLNEEPVATTMGKDFTFMPNGKFIADISSYYSEDQEYNKNYQEYRDVSNSYNKLEIYKFDYPIQFTLPQSLLIAYLNNKSDGYAKDADVNFSAIAKSFNNPEIQEMLGEKFGVLLLKNYILPDLAKITGGYLCSSSLESSSSESSSSSSSKTS